MDHCDRCKKEASSFRMSWFNTQMICEACLSEEKNHPDFKAAKEEVLLRESLGELNYEGAGLPEDLKQKYNMI